MTAPAQARPASEWQRRMASLRDGYLPPDELSIDPRLELHAAYDEELDPITYEVIRSRFWNINWDHQETIRRVSGSGVVVYGYDFNTSLQTEDGEGVVFGPGNLMFAGCADLVVKWTLEHRSWNVGIDPGDVFIQDDPWVGTNHPMDAAVYAPLFVGGQAVRVGLQRRPPARAGRRGARRLRADRDRRLLRGDVHAAGRSWSTRGVLREDVVDAWIRRSRLPELIYLELKSQLAGVEFAAARLGELVARYGAPAVKGVMRRMIRDTETVVRSRLRSLPDGDLARHPLRRRLAARRCARAHRIELRVRKQDGHLHITNAGTERQHGLVQHHVRPVPRVRAQRGCCR